MVSGPHRSPMRQCQAARERRPPRLAFDVREMQLESLPLHPSDDVPETLPVVAPFGHELDLLRRRFTLRVAQREAECGGEDGPVEGEVGGRSMTWSAAAFRSTPLPDDVPEALLLVRFEEGGAPQSRTRRKGARPHSVYAGACSTSSRK